MGLDRRGQEAKLGNECRISEKHRDRNNSRGNRNGEGMNVTVTQEVKYFRGMGEECIKEKKNKLANRQNKNRRCRILEKITEQCE